MKYLHASLSRAREINAEASAQSYVWTRSLDYDELDKLDNSEVQDDTR